MKNLMIVVTLVLVATTAVPAYAQAPAAPTDPHGHEAPTASTPPGRGPGPGMGGGMMPMEMCRQMMAGSMMGGMMGMHADRPMDPKAMAPMMEMHGEMMKAMGEVMMKHARKMGGAPSPRP